MECVYHAFARNGRYAFFVAVSVYAFDYGGLTAVAIVTVARQAAAAVVAPLASPLADRLPRARVMLASDLGRCFCAVGMAVAAARGGNPLLVYALAVTSSAFTAVFRPAEAALIAEVAESPDQLTASNAVASMFDSVGIFIGPALGAVVLSDFGYDFAFALIAGAFAWSSMMIARIATRGLAGRPRRREDRPEDSFGGTLLTGLRRLAYEPDLRLVIGLYDAQFFVAGALGVLQVSVAFELLDVGSLGFGFLDVCAGAGAIVGATFAMNSPRLTSRFLLGLVLWGTPLCLISAVPATWVALLAFALLGAGNSLVDVSAVSLLQRLTPSEMTATVFGVLESSLVVAVALGALAAAPLVDLFGVRGALFVTGGLLPALALLGRRRVSRVHDSDEAVVGRIAALSGVPFLAPLPEPILEFLAARLSKVELNAGTELFALGSTGDAFYILEAGELTVELPHAIRVLTAPDFVGEIALLRDVPRTATVTAKSHAELWSLDSAAFLDAVAGHTEASSAASALTTERLGGLLTV